MYVLFQDSILGFPQKGYEFRKGYPPTTHKGDRSLTNTARISTYVLKCLRKIIKLPKEYVQYHSNPPSHMYIVCIWIT